MKRQAAMLADYENIYTPIVGADGHDAEKHAETPREKLERANVLKVNYTELQQDMLEEVAMIEKRIVHPAQDARTSVKAYKKTIKKREDKKLDYERYRSRSDKLEKQTKRTDRENTALAKHQIDLTSATAVSSAWTEDNTGLRC